MRERVAAGPSSSVVKGEGTGSLKEAERWQQSADEHRNARYPAKSRQPRHAACSAQILAPRPCHPPSAYPFVQYLYFGCRLSRAPSSAAHRRSLAPQQVPACSQSLQLQSPLRSPVSRPLPLLSKRPCHHVSSPTRTFQHSGTQLSPYGCGFRKSRSRSHEQSPRKRRRQPMIFFASINAPSLPIQHAKHLPRPNPHRCEGQAYKSRGQEGRNVIATSSSVGRVARTGWALLAPTRRCRSASNSNCAPGLIGVATTMITTRDSRGWS